MHFFIQHSGLVLIITISCPFLSGSNVRLWAIGFAQTRLELSFIRDEVFPESSGIFVWLIKSSLLLGYLGGNEAENLTVFWGDVWLSNSGFCMVDWFVVKYCSILGVVCWKINLVPLSIAKINHWCSTW